MSKTSWSSLAHVSTHLWQKQPRRTSSDGRAFCEIASFGSSHIHCPRKTPFRSSSICRWSFVCHTSSHARTGFDVWPLVGRSSSWLGMDAQCWSLPWTSWDFGSRCRHRDVECEPECQGPMEESITDYFETASPARGDHSRDSWTTAIYTSSVVSPRCTLQSRPTGASLSCHYIRMLLWPIFLDWTGISIPQEDQTWGQSTWIWPAWWCHLSVLLEVFLVYTTVATTPVLHLQALRAERLLQLAAGKRIPKQWWGGQGVHPC